MEGLTQRASGSENIGYLLINRITELPTVNGREKKARKLFFFGRATFWHSRVRAVTKHSL
jgi:hypothetical protein